VVLAGSLLPASKEGDNALLEEIGHEPEYITLLDVPTSYYSPVTFVPARYKGRDFVQCYPA
jgi:hypothetical protein